MTRKEYYSQPDRIDLNLDDYPYPATRTHNPLFDLDS